VLLVFQVVTQENLYVVALGRGADVVVFNELLLFADHILQVDDGARLQLQVQEQLHVLRLKEVVLHH